MKICVTWAVGFVIALAVCPLDAQTPALSGIEAPYPALQSSVHIAGGIYGPGAVPYGPVGTPLVLSGSNFGSGGSGSTVLFPGAQRGTTIAVTPTSWSGSILLVSVPSSATSGLVQVSAQGKISNGLPLVVTPGVYAGSCPLSPPSSELAIATSSLPDGAVGKAYSATLSAEGGSPPYTWSLTSGSQLPAGLSLSASSGAITGTPTTTGGPYNLVVQATDSQSQAAEAALDLSVDAQALASGQVYSYAAVYDLDGNVAGYNDSVMGMWSFGYDTLNRLMSATPGAGAPGGYAGMNLCMNYDAYGNRTQSNWQAACSPGSDPATARYNPANQVTWTTVNSAVNGFTYDAVGNVTNDGANAYLYDGEGRTCAVSGLGGAFGYIYDAEGRRVAKGTISTFSCNLSSNGFTLTESYVLGQGGEQLTTLNGNQNWQRTNIYGGKQLLATYDVHGLHFHLTDPLGTRRVQTSAVGEPEEDCQGLPFGDGLNCYPTPNPPATADDSNQLHFTGKERDTESGNDYFGARYYSSSMGRWMSPDWASKPEAVPYSDLTNPQSLNLYGYVNNNPLSRADADGHCGDGEDGACSKTLSVTQITNIVVNETQSLHGPDVMLSDAYQSVAHAIINGDNAKGANRPITASDKVNAATQQTQSYKDTKADVQCACQDAAKGVDPTNGSQNFNLRPNDSTKPFQGADIQTQSGPFTNSYPTKDLPKTGIYVNTYKQPTPAPAPAPPPCSLAKGNPCSQ
jgi:RHS repeat-associated protein